MTESDLGAVPCSTNNGLITNPEKYKKAIASKIDKE